MVKITDHMLLPGPTMCQGPFQHFCEEGLDPLPAQCTDKEANSHKPPGKNRRKGQGGCRWSPIAFSDTDLPQTGCQEPNAISYSWLAEATYIATVSFILRF